MSEFEKQKYTIATQLKSLCAHCDNHIVHSCKLQTIASEIKRLQGVPLIINDRFSGMLFTPSPK
jgi:predicted HNH restriction endonuclease